MCCLVDLSRILVGFSSGFGGFVGTEQAHSRSQMMPFFLRCVFFHVTVLFTSLGEWTDLYFRHPQAAKSSRHPDLFPDRGAFPFGKPCFNMLRSLCSTHSRGATDRGAFSFRQSFLASPLPIQSQRELVSLSSRIFKFCLHPESNEEGL